MLAPGDSGPCPGGGMSEGVTLFDLIFPIGNFAGSGFDLRSGLG
jgi:hypothetical protein